MWKTLFGLFSVVFIMSISTGNAQYDDEDVNIGHDMVPIGMCECLDLGPMAEASRDDRGQPRTKPCSCDMTCDGDPSGVFEMDGKWWNACGQQVLDPGAGMLFGESNVKSRSNENDRIYHDNNDVIIPNEPMTPTSNEPLYGPAYGPDYDPTAPGEPMAPIPNEPMTPTSNEPLYGPAYGPDYDPTAPGEPMTPIPNEPLYGPAYGPEYDPTAPGEPMAPTTNEPANEPTYEPPNEPVDNPTVTETNATSEVTVAPTSEVTTDSRPPIAVYDVNRPMDPTDKPDASLLKEWKALHQAVIDYREVLEIYPGMQTLQGGGNEEFNTKRAAYERAVIEYNNARERL